MRFIYTIQDWFGSAIAKVRYHKGPLSQNSRGGKKAMVFF